MGAELADHVEAGHLQRPVGAQDGSAVGGDVPRQFDRVAAVVALKVATMW